MSTEAVLNALRVLWSILKENQVPGALAGGLALDSHSEPTALHERV